MAEGAFVPARGNPRIWLVTFALVTAFVIGSAAGSVASLTLSSGADEQPLSPAGPAAAICESSAFVNYDRLLGNMGAAAERHDIRAWIGYRNQLASLIRKEELGDSVQLVGATKPGCDSGRGTSSD